MQTTGRNVPLLLAVFVFVFCVLESDGYGAGAPNSNCGSMTPSHNVNPQTSALPYTITLDKTTVKGGQPVHVTLSGSKPFAGFLVMGQKHNGGNGLYAETSTAFGTIKKTEESDKMTQYLRCHKIDDSALTHKSNVPKTKVEFDWIAPNEGGDYVILASFVHDFQTFWVRQPSVKIQVTKDDNLQVSSAAVDNKEAVPAAVKSKLAEWYGACGQSKGCFGLPEGCVSREDCQMLTTFEKKGERNVFQIAGKLLEGTGYVASGLSFDDKMHASSIVACVMTGGQVTAAAYYSTADGYAVTRLPNSADTFTDAEGGYENGEIFCEFTRTSSLTIPQLGLTFDLNNNEFYILNAYEDTGEDGLALAYHGVGGRLPAPEAVRLDSTDIIGEGEEDKLRAKFYGGCGESKGCFGIPVGCIGLRDCEMFTSFDSELNFQLMGRIPPGTATEGYVAVGLSFDDAMGQDSVVGCVLETDQVMPWAFYNVPNDKTNRAMTNPLDGLAVQPPGDFVNGFVYCEFTRTEILDSPTELEETFELKKEEYFILLSRSSMGKPERLEQHLSLPEHRAVSDFSVFLNDTSVVELPTEPEDPDQMRARYYGGCGEDKGCYALPHPDCIKTQNCEMFVSFNEQLQFQVTGRSVGYVATGLSIDNKMGEDSVVGCWMDGDTPRVGAYYNGADKVNYGFTDDSMKGIVRGSTVAATFDGYIFCEFTRTSTIEAPQLGGTFNLANDKFHFLLSRAPGATANNLGRHPDNDDKGVSPDAVPLSFIGILGVKSNILIELHASFMIMAWLLCASTGMFTARYYKQTHTDINPLNKAFWFVVHLACMFTTVFLTICGGIFIFVEIGGYSQGLSGPGSWHPILGLILEGLAVCQVLIAFFRPHPGTARRPLFNWVHWTIGNSAHIVGIACIFLAENLAKGGMKGNKAYLFVLVGFVVFHVAMHVVMSIHTVWADKQMDIHNRTRAVRPGPMKPSGKSDEAPGTGFRTFMLSLYLVVAAAVAITLVSLVASKL